MFEEKVHGKLELIINDCIKGRCYYWDMIGQDKNKCPNFKVYLSPDNKYVGYCKIEHAKAEAKYYGYERAR